MKAKKKCLRLNKVRKWALCSLLFIIFFTPFNSIKADDYSFDQLTIDIELLDNGDALIKEVWKIYVNEGTELYKDESMLGACEIHDLKVRDDQGNIYTNIGTNWNVNDTFQQKQYKCGINDENGAYELCFGISEYGNRVYTIEYRMTHFVNAYSDDAGFNQRLINSGMNPAPKNAEVTIFKEETFFDSNNTGIWAFGFNGNIQFVDGKVIAKTYSPITYTNYMNILMRLDKELFKIEKEDSRSFEELKNTAFINSDYLQNDAHGNTIYHPQDEMMGVIPEKQYSIGEVLTGILIVSSLFILFFISVIKNSKSSTSLHAQGLLFDENKIDYSRDLPMNGHLEACYYMLDYLKEMKSETDIMASYLLKWAYQGNIRVEERERKRFFGLSESLEPTILFVNRLGITNDLEVELYDVFEEASGHDQILQEFELKSWSERNYTRLESWMNRIKHQGKKEVIVHQGLEEIEKTSFFGLSKISEIVFTDRGKEFALQLLGFKKYLKDYTLIHEKEVYEVGLWKDYLIFAALFGIADKVADSFKNLYPKYFELHSPGSIYPDRDLYYTLRLIRRMSRASHNGINAARTATSTRASISGGGGFSGGGFGGGVR